jgi:hypothetical protein
MTTELTGSALEIQRALEKLHEAHGDLYTAFNSAGTAAAASVMVLVFTRIEIIERDVTELKQRIEALEHTP